MTSAIENDMPAGKRECDRKMLAELDALVPEGRSENVDRQLVQSIIGLKHRTGLGIDWTKIWLTCHRFPGQTKATNISRL